MTSIWGNTPGHFEEAWESICFFHLSIYRDFHKDSFYRESSIRISSFVVFIPLAHVLGGEQDGCRSDLRDTNFHCMEQNPGFQTIS